MPIKVQLRRSDHSIKITKITKKFVIKKGGHKGDKGDVPLFVGPEAPLSTDVLWVDTDEAPHIISTEDVSETASKRFTNTSDINRLKDTRGVNTGDQDLSYLASKSELTAGLSTKVGPQHDHTSADITDLANLLSEKADRQSVDDAVAALVDTSPEALNTLNELANALGDDPNFATTVSTRIGEKANTVDVDASLNNKVDKISTTSRLYRTGAASSSLPYTANATPDSIMYRDGTTSTSSVGTPTAATHATTKAYVDAADATKLDKTSTASRIYGTGSDGVQSTIPYAALATAHTIAYRTSDGTIQTATPLTPADATTKSYVDSQNALNAAFPTVNSSVPVRGSAGAQTSIPYSYDAIAESIARRSTNGTLGVGTPTATTHATTKAYVDTADSTKVDKVTVANRVYTVNASGAQSSETLNTAATGWSIPQRDASGAIQVATPTLAAHATPKSYVDGTAETTATIRTKLGRASATPVSDGYITSLDYRNAIPTLDQPMNMNVATDAQKASIQSAYNDRMRYLPPEQVSVETSPDNGETWLPMSVSDSIKRNIFSGRSGLNWIETNKNNLLRITLDSYKANGTPERYTNVDLLYIWYNSQGDSMSVKLERSNVATPDTWSTFVQPSAAVSAWPGGCVVRHSSSGFGSYVGQNSNVRKIRMTFKIETNVNKTANPFYSIGGIQYFGGDVYTAPNNFLRTGQIYDYDSEQNVTFPAAVKVATWPTFTDHATNKEYVDTAVSPKANKTGDVFTGNTSVRGGATTDFVVGNAGTDGSAYIQTFRAVSGGRLEWLWGRANAEADFLAISLNAGRNYFDNKTRDFVMRSTAVDNIIVAKTNGNVGIGTLTPEQKLHVDGNARINGVDYITGTGFPNGIISAPIGSIYIDKAITNGASSWIKKSGVGNTGWVVLEGDTGWRNITSTLLFGWTGYFASSIAIRRIGNVCELKLDGIVPTSSTSQHFLTLPSGFVPQGANSRFETHALGVQPSAMYRGYIDTSGACVLSAATSSFPTTFGGLTFFADSWIWPTILPGTAL